MSLAAEWWGRGGCPAKVQVHSSHITLVRGISGGEPLVAHGVAEKKKTRPSSSLIALLPLASRHMAPAGFSAGYLTSLL